MFRPFFRPATATGVRLQPRDSRPFLSPFFEPNSRADGLAVKQSIRIDVSIRAFCSGWMHGTHGFRDTAGKSHWPPLPAWRFGRLVFGDLGAGPQVMALSLLLACHAETHVTGYLHVKQLRSDDFIFKSRLHSSSHLSTRQYARIVDSWVIAIGLEPSSYGTHTMRRTKASLIYRRTKNLRAVQLLLGHTKLESTVRYLGIEVDDALEMAEQTEV